MATFIVTWQNEINDADSPLEAAQDALAGLQANEGVGFTVRDAATDKTFFVDLSDNSVTEEVD